MNRRELIQLGLAAAVASRAATQTPQATSQKYVRYEHAGRISYGILDGETVHELRGTPFGNHARTGAKRKLADVRLLVPCEPSKVLAVGLNYKSHLGNRPGPKVPEIFYKLPTCLLETGGRIVFPSGAENVHYEGEMVIVMGKRARNVSKEEAAGCVLGVTCGNDVSARDWQRNDLQWWRAKASDTFGPLGPAIATGLNYGNLQLQTRLNGQVKQSANTNDLLYDVPTIVSFISQCVTLLPADVIYTGTPGQTSAMKPGDVVEVEIEGIGVLRNTIAGA